MTTVDNDIKIRILRAAKKLFAENGFEGTSVRQICEEAGANVALVSYHFGGKENVFAALFESFFPNDKIRTLRDDGIDPVAGVRLIIREVTLYRQAEPELTRITQHEIVLNTPRIQKIREHVMPTWVQLRIWLERGREQGKFTFRSLDTALMSILGALLFYRDNDYWTVLKGKEQDSIEMMIEDMTVFIMNGLQYRPE
ncbi:TetR family transcriptional regulator [Paenibacillus harenae]|uniref:AcrR family transcriptional regulator n=1 Tax=Paenibacillus harenae TaxID=306543 RepID=A0ABT9U9L8_PAEHA|nr:TetR family transcriptional regulator [Paenibacillus harenae]MDQ0063538.1 AcrR family transcriptional regulator [Paenibacillus harenae]MDQ0115703.1 AcrR family transcriptional regulator [Paenibacillus harenae]